MSDTYLPSPVPSDQRLAPGELPFTAFGQFGEGSLDLRVFDQGVWWVDRRGVPHLIEEMSFDYVVNVIMFLRDFQGSYHDAVLMRAAVQLLGDLGRGLPPLEGLDPLVIASLSASQWLEGTPLMGALLSRSLSFPVD